MIESGSYGKFLLPAVVLALLLKDCGVVPPLPKVDLPKVNLPSVELPKLPIPPTETKRVKSTPTPPSKPTVEKTEVPEVKACLQRSSKLPTIEDQVNAVFGKESKVKEDLLKKISYAKDSGAKFDSDYHTVVKDKNGYRIDPGCDLEVIKKSQPKPEITCRVNTTTLSNTFKDLPQAESAIGQFLKDTKKKTGKYEVSRGEFYALIKYPDGRTSMTKGCPK